MSFWQDLGALFTPVEKTKLAGIATGADVTADNDPKSHGSTFHTDRTREMFLAAHQYTNGGVGANGVNLDKDVDENVIFRFKMPRDFVSIGSIKLIYQIRNTIAAGGDAIIDVDSWYGEVGQSCYAHTAIDNGNTLSFVPADKYYFKSTTLSGLLSSVVSGDICSIRVKRDADHASDDLDCDFYVNGLLIEYTADM